MKKSILKTISAGLLLTALGATTALADIVYVTSTCSNATSTTVCNSAINPDLNAYGFPVYTDAAVGFTSALSTKPDGPLTPGARYFGTGFTNTSNPDTDGFTINPVLGVPGGVYRLYHIYSSAAGNVNTNSVLSATNVENCTLNFNQTDKFQSSYGTAVAGKQVYQLLGYVTNNVGANSPKIRFYYKSGLIDTGLGFRLVVDTFKFALDNACLDIPVVGVTGPLGASLSTVAVTGVISNATKITVYQDSGSGFVQIGALTTGVVVGNNTVPVTGLVKGAKVAATQTIGGIDGCTPTAGTLVGGGANPSVGLALSIRETPSTGPVGTPGNSTSANIHFLGATNTTGGAPVGSLTVYPSNGWQTVTLSGGRTSIANVTNAAGTAQISASGFGYPANNTVAIKVYAFKSVNGTTIYSATGAQTPTVISNDTFAVHWTWDAVPGVDGYRLVLNLNTLDNYASFDVTGNSFTDDFTAWQGAGPVTPTNSQVTSSILWNGLPAGATTIATKWGILESLAFSIADNTDTGPYDLYIDNIQNGTNVFQTFETAPANTTDYGFRAPSFSGTTSGNLLASPNVGAVANRVADTGTKSFHVQFQWQALTANKWLRLTTSGVNNPQMNLDEPVSIRLLLQPTGATLPAAPAAPTLAASTVSGKMVLNWTGGHILQTSVNVPGTYTNVPQVLSANTWTNITLGAFLSPWTNNFTEPTRFFRLRD
jgi:hypothetical protein